MFDYYIICWLLLLNNRRVYVYMFLVFWAVSLNKSPTTKKKKTKKTRRRIPCSRRFGCDLALSCRDFRSFSLSYSCVVLSNSCCLSDACFFSFFLLLLMCAVVAVVTVAVWKGTDYVLALRSMLMAPKRFFDTQDLGKNENRRGRHYSNSGCQLPVLVHFLRNSR